MLVGSLVLLAVNIVLLILNFVFVNNMSETLMYASLIWVMVSTPILLYISMRTVRKRIEDNNAK